LREKHLQSATAQQALQGNEVRGAEEENLVLPVNLVLTALLVQKEIRENKVIRDLGWCFLKSIMGFSLLISSSLNAASLRVTKDRLGLQDPQGPLAQEGLQGTQGKMAPVECQECPVNQGNQENKA